MFFDVFPIILRRKSTKKIHMILTLRSSHLLENKTDVCHECKRTDLIFHLAYQIRLRRNSSRLRHASQPHLFWKLCLNCSELLKCASNSFYTCSKHSDPALPESHHRRSTAVCQSSDVRDRRCDPNQANRNSFP